MPWLPDAHGRSVRLNLIDIAPLNPNRLALDNGLLNNRRLLHHHRLSNHSGLLNHDRLGHDSRRGLNHDRLGVTRTRQRRSDYAANHPADESRPEVPTARPPIATVVMMVAAVPTMMNRRRAMESPVMRSTMPTTRERAGRNCRKGNCYYEFLHLICPFFFRLN